MATGDTPTHVLFRPGQDITVKTTGAVTTARFVNISATMELTPASFSATTPITGGNLIKVAHATAAGKAFGVSRTDIASGEVGLVIREGIVAIESSGVITAGDQVEVGAAGVAVVLAAGIACGQAVTTAASNIVYVALNL